MKFKPIFLTILILVGFLGVLACSKEEIAEDLTGGCLNFTEEYQGVMDASSAYGENPTSKNCQAYKSAWLDFFEDYNDCPYWDNYDYQETINEIESMDCGA